MAEMLRHLLEALKIPLVSLADPKIPAQIIIHAHNLMPNAVMMRHCFGANQPA